MTTLVLNVEDHEASRYAKSRVLRNAGYLVREACSGAEALELVRQLQPHVVLLDVRLPDINGLEICRRIRTDPDTKDVVVIQTSAAFISPADVAEGLGSGADQYLPAPFEPRDLVAMVRSFDHLTR